MKFSSKLKSYFLNDVRMRGERYFQEKRVNYRIVGNFAAHALVKGTQAYACSFLLEVSKDRHSVLIEMECECPYFQNGQACKHLWATALALDYETWSAVVAQARRVDVAERDELDWDELDDDDDEDDEDDWEEEETGPIAWDIFKTRVAPPSPVAHLDRVLPQGKAGKSRSLYFVLDIGPQLEGGDLVVRFYYRDHLLNGKLGVLKSIPLRANLVEEGFRDPVDQELFRLLLKECDGFKQGYASSHYRGKGLVPTARREEMEGFLLEPREALLLLAKLSAKDKLFIFENGNTKGLLRALRIVEEPWHLEVEVIEYDKSHYQLSAVMAKADVARPIDHFLFLSDGRFAIVDDVLHPVTLFDRNHGTWLEQLTLDTAVVFLKKDFDAFVSDYSRLPLAPHMRWPEGFGWTKENLSPKPRLRLNHYFTFGESWLNGEIIFQYPHEDVNSLDMVPSWVDHNFKKISLRDFSAEQGHIDFLHSLSEVHPLTDPDLWAEGKTLSIRAGSIASVIPLLEDQGWDIDVEDKKVKMLTDFEIVVQGETDWFDLSITAKVDAKSYRIPELLRNKVVGGVFMPLGNKEYALMPEEWLRRLELLSRAGTMEGDALRVPSPQLLLIDSLLADLQIDNRSQNFQRIRQKVRDFKSLEAVEAPEGFRGILREYQKEGLAWLEFLQDFGFGGCLSDEMGLGKTIQVLAMLLRYHHRKQRPPSLIVVPRSLVSNWIAEAEKFCPALRVCDMSGSSREWSGIDPTKVDLIITTYGLLRQDIKTIVRHKYGYLILDESQVIKNSKSQAAKASLLPKAQHRLAMSGTPIENHMGELMSLMGFLNPGLLDGSHWQELFKRKFDSTDPLMKNLITSLKPLMLRRTKAQVLKDLPEKVEDVLYCDLEGDQKAHYEQLKLHYQMNLLPSLRDETWKKSSIVVIEALLRLRQAACHSGLVDAKYKDTPSAKLEALFDKLEEIRESGHKALIFSQFTSLLKIVSEKFAENHVPYEYLDGRTRDRAARVARFQTDPRVPFFLISLKAGGVGLNLTAADYCFILDPWWNPAAEAQAIDRAHRINQKNTVFAYRIIARNTVEEKIQALQNDKKQMVESILEGEGALLQSLDLKSIQSLFS